MKLATINTRLNEAIKAVNKHKVLRQAIGLDTTKGIFENATNIRKAMDGQSVGFFLTRVTKNKAILKNTTLGCELCVLEHYSRLFFEAYNIDQTI